jgi:hypothetical protein
MPEDPKDLATIYQGGAFASAGHPEDQSAVPKAAGRNDKGR